MNLSYSILFFWRGLASLASFRFCSPSGSAYAPRWHPQRSTPTLCMHCSARGVPVARPVGQGGGLVWEGLGGPAPKRQARHGGGPRSQAPGHPVARPCSPALQRSLPRLLQPDPAPPPPALPPPARPSARSLASPRCRTVPWPPSLAPQPCPGRLEVAGKGTAMEAFVPRLSTLRCLRPASRQCAGTRLSGASTQQSHTCRHRGSRTCAQNSPEADGENRIGVKDALIKSLAGKRRGLHG